MALPLPLFLPKSWPVRLWATSRCVSGPLVNDCTQFRSGTPGKVCNVLGGNLDHPSRACEESILALSNNS